MPGYTHTQEMLTYQQLPPGNACLQQLPRERPNHSNDAGKGIMQKVGAMLWDFVEFLFAAKSYPAQLEAIKC